MQLSIIVPVYNMAAEKKLEYCLDSLVAQTVADYEIIAVDDCSADESWEILKSYEARFPDKFRALHLEENRHQGGAKNAGLRIAQGEWIGFIDSDDWITPDMYERLIGRAISTGADLVGCDYCLTSEHSMKVGQVDIIKLLSQLLEEFYPSFADNNLTYELTSDVPAQMICADANLLARLFDNLINNAIKYGAEGKRIQVNVCGGEELATISITNYGRVIPPEELPMIFNKFYRVEHSRSTSTGGTGLGLAIAKNVVDMHGGSIQVTSDLNGTVFTVKLKVHFDVNKENFGEIG